MTIQEKYSIIGWAMYEKGYTKEQLDNLSPFEVIMLNDDYNRAVAAYAT